MGRPLRNTDPELIRHISARTLGAQLLLQPSKALNEMVGGVIAKYQETHNIVLYAYTILGNHYHLVAQAPKQNLWKFERDINKEISRRTNRLRNRTGSLWGRRYDEQIIPDNNECIDALLYVVCNPVKHGLVELPSQWPGVNSYNSILSEKPQSFRFTNFTDYSKAKLRARRTGERVRIEDSQTIHKLSISPIPQFAKMQRGHRRKLLEKLIKGRIREIHEQRRREGKGFLGLARILKQNPKSYPRDVERTHRPICYTKNFLTKQKFMEWFFSWLEAYRKASRKFRSGNYSTEFPPYSIPPPLLCIPA